MVTMILYARQQKRHRCKEQTFGLCGRRGWWDDLREQHWNMFITICEIDHQPKLHAWSRTLKASALGQPWGIGWGGRWKEDSEWGTYVHPWLIHVNVWQKSLQCCKVISLQLKEKKHGGLRWWLSGKESVCRCRRHRFDSWSGKSPHAVKQQRLGATTAKPRLA